MIISHERPLIQSVCFYNPDYYPPIVRASFLLNEIGLEQNLICRANTDIWEISYPLNTHVIRLKPRFTSGPFEFIEFILNILRNQKNVSVFIGYDMHGLVVCGLLGILHNKPVVYHCHDFVDDAATSKRRLGSKIIKLLERKLAPRASFVIVPDPDRAMIVYEELQLKEFPLIVANAPLEPVRSNEGILHKTLSGLDRYFTKIVFRQGTIGKDHCIEATIKSIPYWASDKWGFVIIGPCKEEYRKQLVQLAKSLGVEDRFVILPPVKSFYEVYKYTVEADVGIALYPPTHINNRYMTLASNKTMEYIAAGIPIVLSDTPGSHKLLEKYKVGVVADPGSEHSIAKSINGILSNENDIKSMQQAGLRAFEEEFNYRHQYAPALARIKLLVQQGKED